MFKKMLLPVIAFAAVLAGAHAADARHPMPAMTGPDHGMPVGKMGGDGATYRGPTDLEAAASLIAAGGPPSTFSIAKAITAMTGAKIAHAEIAKLTKQYGSAAFKSYVTVQNFAVNDADHIMMRKPGVFRLPVATLTGADLAKRIVGLGLVGGTYYEGTQLDHLLTHNVHEHVMGDIDNLYGAAADANYHKISDQAHYDLAHALGVRSVNLAPFH